MRRSSEDLLIQTAARRHPVENLLVQFSVLSLAIMTILGIVISVILTTRLNRDFELLKQHAATTSVGGQGPSRGISIQDLDTDLTYLRWTTYVAVGGGFVILYTGLIWVVWRGWRTIKDQQDELLEINADLRDASQEIRNAQLRRLQATQEAREQERKRLSEELHDETLAELASVIVDLGFLSRDSKQLPPELQEGLAELRNRVRGSELKLRQLVQGIFPAVLTNLGLMPALRTHLEELAGRPIDSPHPLELEMKAKGLDDGRLPEDVEIAVYRVVQQGLANAIRHANAKRLHAELVWAGSELTVSIADDGRGFDVTKLERTPTSGHFGLVTLKDRIEALGGVCDIESQLSEGTTIRASLPTQQRASVSTAVQTSVFVLGNQETAKGRS